MTGSPLLYTAHVPAGDGPFPTIVLLHGWGAGAHDLFGLAPHIHGGRALVLCPQGSVVVPYGGGEHGHGWFPLVPGVPPDIDAFRHAAGQLRAFVDLACTRYPIDPQAIAVAGFSQGGMMAYELALRDPARYSGLAALSAYLPEQLIEDLPRLPEQKDLPVLVIHGTADSQISVDKARQSREALRLFEVSLTYREFDMAHEIRHDALRLFTRWVDDRAFRRAGPAAAAPST